jgi:hypothetical protein
MADADADADADSGPEEQEKAPEQLAERPKKKQKTSKK